MQVNNKISCFSFNLFCAVCFAEDIGEKGKSRLDLRKEDLRSIAKE